MKIIVIGDGKVGYTLTEQLSKEGHDIVVIDKNPQALRQSVDVLDVMGIQEMCIRDRTSTSILTERPPTRRSPH